MRIALLADIHGNIDALTAVLAKLRGIEYFICAGDLVGYGGSPNQVVEVAMLNGWVVCMGNHEAACAGLLAADWFNPTAKTAVLWTKHTLNKENMLYLRKLRVDLLRELFGLKFYIIHGSVAARSFTDYTAAPVAADFRSQISVIGHTHVQCGWVKYGSEISAIHRAVKIEPGAQYLINPGGLGQPRDGDSRAPFAIIDVQRGLIRLERVEYDIQAAADKILTAGLPAALAERLWTAT